MQRSTHHLAFAERVKSTWRSVFAHDAGRVRRTGFIRTTRRAISMTLTFGFAWIVVPLVVVMERSSTQWLRSKGGAVLVLRRTRPELGYLAGVLVAGSAFVWALAFSTLPIVVQTMMVIALVVAIGLLLAPAIEQVLFGRRFDFHAGDLVQTGSDLDAFRLLAPFQDFIIDNGVSVGARARSERLLGLFVERGGAEVVRGRCVVFTPDSVQALRDRRR